jgi:ZIP family zinc transporter
MSPIVLALLLTTFAGLSTGIGGLISLFGQRDNTKFLTISLGFSAGVMVYVSFVNLFQEGQELLISELGGKTGLWVAVIALFGGMLLIGLIDRLVPQAQNPHEVHDPANVSLEKTRGQSMLRAGLFTALAVGIHNFPEGIATFISAVTDPSLGLPIAIAIAIHNIPEGIAVLKRCALRNRLCSGGRHHDLYLL